MQNALSVSDKTQLADTRAELAAFTSELKANGLAAKSAGDRWKDLAAKAKDLFSAASMMRMVFTHLKKSVETAIEMDKVYTDLIKVQSELSRGDYAEYLAKCNRKAQELATTQKSLMEGAAEFSKSGYDSSTSDKLTEKSTILSNVGEMSASDSAKAIISGIQAYDVVDGYTDVVEKAQKLIDKYNEIGNTASITTAEIAEGVQKVGSVFADANTSVDQLIALASAGNRQYQDADSLFLGLRTSALRIRGCTAELEAMGEETDTVVTSTAKLEEQIKALTNINGSGGVEILEADGETFRSIYDIFLDISKVYKDMNDTDASALLELIAGKHRASAISATLNNMTEAEELLQKSLNSAGSAQKEYNTYLDSTEAHINQFKSKLTETYTELINGNAVSFLSDIGTVLLDIVNKTDIIRNTLIAIGTIKIGKGIATVAGVVANTAKQMNTLGNALQQVKDLPLDKALRKDVLDDIGKATKDLTEKNLKLLLSQENLEESDMIAILRKHDLTEEQAKEKLAKMGLTTATNANTAANTANTASVTTLKGAFVSLKTSIQAAWAAMSMLEKASIILTAVTTIWSITSSVISGLNNIKEEARQKSMDTANAAITEAKSLQELYTKYQQLASIQDRTESQENEYKTALDEVTKALGDKSEALKGLTEDTDDYVEALKKASQEEMKEAWGKAKAGTKAAKEAVIDDVGTLGSDTQVDMPWRFGRDNEAYKIAVKYLKDYRDFFNTAWGTNSDDIDIILDYYYRIKSAKEEIEQLDDESQLDSTTYENLVETYNNLTESVETYAKQKYEELVLNYEWQNGIPTTTAEYDKMKESILEASGAGKEYRSVISDMMDSDFSGLINGFSEVEKQFKPTASPLTFNEILSNSIGTETIDDYTKKINSLESYLNKLEDGSYSPIDKATLANSFGIAGDSVEELTGQIKELMDTETDGIIAKIDDILNTKNLDEKTRKELESLRQTMQDVTETAQNIASFPLTGNALADVQKLSEGLDQLDKIYADVFDQEDFDFSSILNNEAFSKAFRGYTEEYSHFIDTISKSPDDINACQNAFNQLTSAYIQGSGVLNEVTESTKDAVIQMLEQMGIANAQEIVMKALAAQEAFLAVKKKDSAIQSETLAEATWQEISAVLAEGEAAAETESYLAQLALAKLDITNNPINSDADVSAIIAIADAAGTSREYVAALQAALENLVKAQENVKRIQDTEVNGSFAEVAKTTGLIAAKAMETSAKETSDKLLADIQSHIDSNRLDASKFMSNYKGGSATKSAAEKAQKEKEKADKEAEKEAEKSKTEKQIDFFEYRLTELDQAISTVETHMDNFTGSAAKNLAVDTLIKIDTQKQSDLQKSLSLYTHMAEEEFAKIPAQFREMAKNGAVNITDFIETADDENGTIAEAIENYRKWADKVDDVSNSIEELNSTMRQLELDKFKNIADDYSKLLDQISQSTDKLNTLMDTQEKINGTKSRAFYEELITQTKIQLEYLQKEKSILEQQMYSAIGKGITAGSNEWVEMESALEDINTQIIQCMGSMEGFADSIREIDVSNLEKVMDSFSYIETEIDRLLSLMDTDEAIDSKGNLTQSAITQIGLLAQQQILAARKTEEYKKALEGLDTAYSQGKVNFTEYQELYKKLNDGLADSIQAQKEAKEAVFQFKKQVIDKEIENINKARDAYKEYIDAKKEALDRESDNHDFQKELADLRKELTSLDTQIGQLTGDDDYTLAKKAELMQQRNEKQEELNEKLYDRSIEQQKDALDKEYEDYSADCDRRIEKLEESIKETTENIEREFDAMMENISGSADHYLAGLNQLCNKYGIHVSQNLTEPWEDGKNALGEYHDDLDYHTGSFNSMLDEVKQHIYDDGMEADNTAQKLMDTFGLSADNLKGELSQVWYGLNSDTERSAALTGSIWTAFNTQDSTPLVIQLNNVETAAQSAANAADSLAGAGSRAANAVAGAANSISHAADSASQSLDGMESKFVEMEQTAANGMNQLLQIGVSIPANMATATTKMLRTVSSAVQEAAYAVVDVGKSLGASDPLVNNVIAGGLTALGIMKGASGFAEGGVITKKDDYLKPLANSIGEDTMVGVKYGERVLTKEENEAYEEYQDIAENAESAAGDTPSLTKDIFAKHNIPTPDWGVIQEKLMQEPSKLYKERLAMNENEIIRKNATINTETRNIDNSMTFNRALIEVKGDIHRDDMKEMEKVAQRVVKRAFDKQTSALRTYIGI